MVTKSASQRLGRFLRSDIALCLLTCVPAIIIFLAVSLYNHPIGDDFWCTAMVRKYGYWNAQVRLYNIVPPRYFELAISCLTPLSFGNFSGYKVIPILFILLFVHVMTGLFRTMSGRPRAAYREMILPAVLFVTLYLAVMPGIAEGIYWTSALSVYHTGIILFIVWCNYSLKWYSPDRKPVYVVVAALCMAGMLGCNELISIVVIAVMAVIVWHRFRGRSGGIDLMSGVQLMVIALCILFILCWRGAGNRYLLVRTEASGRLLYSIGYSLVLDGYYIGKCLINPFFWALAIAGRRVFEQLARRLLAAYPDLFTFRASFLLIWGGILVVIPFMIIYLTGERPPLRICNMIVFFFLLGLLYPVALLPRGIKGGKYAGVIVPLLLLAGALLPNNVSQGAKDLLSGSALRYDKAWEHRYTLIRQCGGDSCELPRLGVVAPFVFRFEPDTTEPHISEYFDKHIIIQ